MLVQINLITKATPAVRLYDHSLGHNMRYSIDGGRLYRSNATRSRVEDLSYNVAGALISEDGICSYTFNAMPGAQTMNYIRHFLAKKTDELKTAFAFLYGGQAYDGTPKSAQSNSLYSGIANIIDELNIPLGMICGKYSADKTGNMVVHGHIINVWGDNLNKMDRHMNKNDIIKSLEEEYETVEIPDSVGLATFEGEPTSFEANNFYESKLRLKAAN